MQADMTDIEKTKIIIYQNPVVQVKSFLDICRVYQLSIKVLNRFHVIHFFLIVFVIVKVI